MNVQPEPNERSPWVFKTGKGIFSSPVVDESDTVYIGSADHIFYAINPDGSIKWKLAVDEIIDSSALLDDQRLYFASGDDPSTVLIAQRRHNLAFSSCNFADGRGIRDQDL